MKLETKWTLRFSTQTPAISCLSGRQEIKEDFSFRKKNSKFSFSFLVFPSIVGRHRQEEVILNWKERKKL